MTHSYTQRPMTIRKYERLFPAGRHHLIDLAHIVDGIARIRVDHEASVVRTVAARSVPNSIDSVPLRLYRARESRLIHP